MNNDLRRHLERIKNELTQAYESGTLWEYLEETEVYNHDFTINLSASGKLEYKSVSIMVACGGPNIYIDTGAEFEIIGLWGGSKEVLYLDSEIVEEIDNYFEDLYKYMKER